MENITTATAIYTGGGIYIYYGKLTDGNYFRACDDWKWIEICNSDTSTEEADYYEFYEEHSIDCLTGKEYEEFWNRMLKKIIEERPVGNYQEYELEKRLLPELSVISFDIECFDRTFTIETFKDDAEKAKNIIRKSYELWVENVNEVAGDMCCEEFIINELEENFVVFRVIVEG